jgi:hypothetical protein
MDKTACNLLVLASCVPSYQFSKIAGRNNHVITNLALTLSELLFPFIPETKNGLIKEEPGLKKKLRIKYMKTVLFFAV